MAIRGGTKSVDALRASMKKGSGGGDFIRTVPPEGLIVRFLQEPDEWFEFSEHWDEAENRPAICTDDCMYCDDDVRASKRVLASALVRDEDKVIPLKMATTLVRRLLKYYDKWDTITDRDYELERDGEGRDTEYNATPTVPKRLRLDNYEPLDAQEILEEQAGVGTADEDDPPSNPKKKRPAKKVATRPSTGSGRRTIDPDDDDPPWDEEEEDRQFTRATRARKPAAKVKPKARVNTKAAPSIKKTPKPGLKKLR